MPHYFQSKHWCTACKWINHYIDKSHHRVFLSACVPVEFRECVWGWPAEPPVCVGADEPRAAAPEGGALSGLACPQASAQSSAPAGEMSADGPGTAEPPSHQVYINPCSLDQMLSPTCRTGGFCSAFSQMYSLIFRFLRWISVSINPQLFLVWKGKSTWNICNCWEELHA